MPIWRLVPAAAANDPRWQGRTIWAEVTVRANSAAEARLQAAELEYDPAAPPVGNESLGFRSGFDDEKLYWIVRLDTEDAHDPTKSSGPPAVLSAIRREPTPAG
jgi:hypothetical protein